MAKQNRDYVRALSTIPTNDSNFDYALKRYATDDEIRSAIEIMQASPAGNKSRITACERELRRRYGGTNAINSKNNQ